MRGVADDRLFIRLTPTNALLHVQTERMTACQVLTAGFPTARRLSSAVARSYGPELDYSGTKILGIKTQPLLSDRVLF